MWYEETIHTYIYIYIYIYMHLSHLPTRSCENIYIYIYIYALKPLAHLLMWEYFNDEKNNGFFFFFGYKSGIFNQIKTQVHEHDMIQKRTSPDLQG